MNNTTTADNSDIAVLKDAARLLQQHLGATGIKLTHGLALEALTASLGCRNWRTLRAKLSAPTASREWDPAQPRWAVHAVYDDNDERYCAHVFGASPLEAQINAQMERLAELGSIGALAVTCVIDRHTGEPADEEDHTYDTDLISMSACLKKVYQLAAPAASTREDLLAVHFWHAVLTDKSSCDFALASVLEERESDAIENPGSPQVTTKAGETIQVDVVQTLKRLVALAESVVPTGTFEAKRSGLFQVLQLKSAIAHMPKGLAADVAIADAEYDISL
ncbi:hypothetical protein D3C71_19510 [compost metagenome]